MLLNLSDLSSETLQEQFVRQVRALILSGELTGGDELPSIRGLARDHQVSVITVQRAYEALERGGLIQARRGKGFFVSPLTEAARLESALSQLDDRLEPVLEQARAEGLTAEHILRRVSTLLDSVVV